MRTAAALDYRVLQPKKTGGFGIGLPDALRGDAEVLAAAVPTAVAAVARRWTTIKLLPAGLRTHPEVVLAAVAASPATRRRAASQQQQKKAPVAAAGSAIIEED